MSGSAKILRIVETTNDARFALLARLIDHAPLFPPASLPLPDALAEDERARKNQHAFMLGRFVCPASRCSELPDDGRAISAVLDSALPDGVHVDAVEARYRDDLGSLVELADEVYVEIPLDDELEERLDALARQGLRAKVRCGGATVPSAPQLAAFVSGCRDRGLVFKATAGLHGAVRSNGEHGLLNLFAAVVFGDELRALSETNPAAFALGEHAFVWRDRSALVAELMAARRDRPQSIGSCSFFEPVAALEALGVLPL